MISPKKFCKFSFHFAAIISNHLQDASISANDFLPEELGYSFCLDILQSSSFCYLTEIISGSNNIFLSMSKRHIHDINNLEKIVARVRTVKGISAFKVEHS